MQKKSFDYIGSLGKKTRKKKASRKKMKSQKNTLKENEIPKKKILKDNFLKTPRNVLKRFKKYLEEKCLNKTPPLD